MNWPPKRAARGAVHAVAVLIAASILPACNGAPKDDWRIEPRKRAGALLSTGSDADLRKAYGDRNVTPGRILLGEGESAMGTILFPDDTLRRLEIVWADSVNRHIPARIFLRGSRSLWKLPGDATLGMPLADLERANGRPFMLAGFGWDYEGVVISWEGGVLDTTLPDVKVYLKPSSPDRARAEYSRLLGDRPYASTLPEMRALNPRVYQILVDFEHLSSPGESAHTPKYEIREEDRGKTFRFQTGTRFAVILDERTHPQRTLTSTPQGIVGRVSNALDVDPPLYAARLEAVKPGTCEITARNFSVRIQVFEKADSTAAKADSAATAN